MYVLQEIHLIVREYVFLLQDTLEAAAIDRVISRFVVYKDEPFILMFLK
jgi:hypothetical protein